jgi:hypothetical protein
LKLFGIFKQSGSVMGEDIDKFYGLKAQLGRLPDAGQLRKLTRVQILAEAVGADGKFHSVPSRS